MPCSGFYTDVRKSESKAIDMSGWKKIVQSYIKYLGNDVPPIKISEYFITLILIKKEKINSKNIFFKFLDFSTLIWAKSTVCEDILWHPNFW